MSTPISSEYFLSSVHSEFKFLEEQYEFVCSCNDQYVVYTSEHMNIAVCYEYLSHEFYIYVIYNHDPDGYNKFNLSDIMYFAGASTEKNEFIQIAKKEFLNEYMLIYSQFIKANIDMLSMGSTVIEEIKGRIITEKEQIKRDYFDNELKRLAEKAWYNKDYAKVVEYYSKIEPNDKINNLRMEYAKRKLSVP